MKPMLAWKWQNFRKRVDYPAYVQPKLNGIRMLYQAGYCASRENVMWKPTMLTGIREQLAYLPQNILLDGELYVHGWSLQKINRAIAVGRNEPIELSEQVEYHVFDLIDFTQPMLNFYARLELRDTLLARVKFARHSLVQLVDTQYVIDELRFNALHAQYREQGYEGSIFRSNEPYGFSQLCGNQENRWSRLLKRKDWLDDEFEIVGVHAGDGRLQDTLGAIECRCDYGTFRVGSGFDDTERTVFWRNPPIGELATVRYEMLSDDGLPLKPTFIALRK